MANRRATAPPPRRRIALRVQLGFGVSEMLVFVAWCHLLSTLGRALVRFIFPRDRLRTPYEDASF